MLTLAWRLVALTRVSSGDYKADQTEHNIAHRAKEKNVNCCRAPRQSTRLESCRLMSADSRQPWWRDFHVT